MTSTGDTPWVEGHTIGQVLEETAAKFPNRDALVFPSLTMQYGDYLQYVS